MSVKINISNKAFYSLVAILAFVIIAVVVYATGTSNPFVFGHTVGELTYNETLGLEEWIKEIINEEISGDFVCVPDRLVFDSINCQGCNIGTKNNAPIDLPSSCTSDLGCTIKREIYYYDSATRQVKLKQAPRIYNFFQSSAGGNKWWSDYQASGEFANGDSQYTHIVPYYNYLSIYDDYAATGYTERYANKISIIDSSTSYGMKVYMCSS